MQGYRLRGNERGSVLIFMLGTFLFLLVFGGFAIDLAFYSVAKGELQRSMDAAALAGVGHLDFDGSVFPTSIGANPQLSIYGMSCRLATGLAEKLTGKKLS